MDVNTLSWEHNGGAEVHFISVLTREFVLVFLAAFIPLVLFIARRRWKIPPTWPTAVPFPSYNVGIVSRIWKCYQGWPFLSPKLQEGYDRFNRHDKPFLFPNFALRPQVILPAKDLDWLMKQPDTVISTSENQNENLGLAHVFLLTRPIPGEKIVMTAIHTHVNRHTSRIQADVYDELKASIDRELGTDTAQWCEVKITKAMASVIQSVGAFGLPMRRDQQWLASAERTTSFLGAAMISGQLIPWYIQPVISPLFKFVCDIIRMQSFQSIRPIFKTWYDRILEEKRDGACDPTVPYNFATSPIRTSLKDKDHKRADVPTMFTTTLIMALLPFNTSSLKSTATFFDIASAASEDEVYKTLREETTQHVQTEEDWKTLPSFANMPYTESVARESLCLNPSQARALNKEAVRKVGLPIPSGQHLTMGTWLGAASMGIHLDDRFYSDGKKYKPFLFVKKVSEQPSQFDVGDQVGVGSAKPEDQDKLDSGVPFLLLGRHCCSDKHSHCI